MRRLMRFLELRLAAHFERLALGELDDDTRKEGSR